jgi:phosphatidate cytidylyltransferase
MLKQRLLTALVMLPLVVWGILALPTAYFASLLGLVIAQGAWEWGGIMGLRSLSRRGGYLLLVVLCLCLAAYAWMLPGGKWYALPALSLVWWLLALVWVLTYPRNTKCWVLPAMQAMIGILVLVPSWLAVIALHGSGAQGPSWVLYLLSLIWVADSGAYFGGKRWGRHKLAAAVSPGKTWEGAAAALVLSGLYAFGASYVLSIDGNQWPLFVVLSLMTVAFSILGDLTESMFKRHAGLKDSGNLLPGHGGILDRIDSVTAAAPVFVVGVWLTGMHQLGGLQG